MNVVLAKNKKCVIYLLNIIKNQETLGKNGLVSKQCSVNWLYIWKKYSFLIPNTKINFIRIKDLNIKCKTIML